MRNEVHMRRAAAVVAFAAILSGAGACSTSSIEDDCGRLAKAQRDAGDGTYEGNYDACINDRKANGA